MVATSPSPLSQTNSMARNNLGLRKGGAVLAAVLAVGVSLLGSPLSRKYPLFRWIVRLDPTLAGRIPALSSEPRGGDALAWLRNADLRGQTALVTGANSGIGFEIARVLSRQGATVTLACRNQERCFAAAHRITKEKAYYGATVRQLVMDMSDLKSVKVAVSKYYLRNQHEPKLDMLFLNAGTFPERHAADATALPLSKDGIEKTFATNVVGHHLLYRLLEPALKRSNMARVVSTSSDSGFTSLPPRSPMIPATREELNEGPPSEMSERALYGRSKLGQVAWTEALTKRLEDNSTIYVNAAHPGVVYTPMIAEKNFPPWIPTIFTGIVRYLMERVIWSPREGALTQLYLGVATDEMREKEIRGQYFRPPAIKFDHPYGGDGELQENVWNLCEELVKDFV